MKPILFIGIITLIGSSCSKPYPYHPVPVHMDYIIFNNKEIGFNQRVNVDLNHDGRRDFSIYTMRVGDPETKTDYQQYYFGSAEFTEFPIDSREEVPVLNTSSLVNEGAYTGHSWWPASDIVMAQKVVPLSQTPYWKGNWKEAFHNYLPLRIFVGYKVFYGWVEVSFYMADGKVILHRAAIAKESNAEVRAGE